MGNLLNCCASGRNEREKKIEEDEDNNDETKDLSTISQTHGKNSMWSKAEDKAFQGYL